MVQVAAAIQRAIVIYGQGDLIHHESGAAPPENFIGGFIRVHSENSWFRFVTLGQASGTGSFTFPTDQEV